MYLSVSKHFKTYLKVLCFLLLTYATSFNARATHIYGADLFYQHVSGLTYEVTLVVYGDCGGSAFPSLSTASAEVRVFNNSSLYTTLTLISQSPTNGVEVTPVCPSQINNTNCNSTTGTIPGVKKFTFKRTVTLNTTSSNWRFRFTGDMGNTSAGRSTTITNITGSGSAVMNLEATLNNTNGPNSSPTYTTIPTPFFCINKAANYNPGTVDPNSDSLYYTLVPGLTSTGTVVYTTGYTATTPLAAATGTFSFNNNTGQLAFTPNAVQRSLVVNKVEEYKNGTLVGSSMREMTFVVLNNCNNNPPGGTITNNTNGTVDTNGIELDVCRSDGTLNFNINPTDPDTDKINMVVNGLPTGATFNISNNNTTAPTGSFSWNISNVAINSYTFFVTYTDEGCPLSSKQTIAYTINLLPEPAVSISIDTPATCTKKAVFSMTPSVAPSPWRLQVLAGSVQLHNFTGVTGTQIDSLFPGTYTIRVTNADTCFLDTTLVIPSPPDPILGVVVTHPVCNGDSNAVVTLSGSSGTPAYTYNINGGTYSSNTVFNNLPAGFYTFKIKDSNDCVADSLVGVIDPPSVSADITFVQPPCNFYNSGVINVSGKNGVTPYLYALDNNPLDTVTTFSGLYSGNYDVHVVDSNNCKLDTTVTLPDSVRVHANAVLTNILCNGDSTGAITLTAFGATPTYKYQLGAGSLSTNNSFNNLPATTHTFHIEDTNQCYLDTNITLTEPTPVTSPANITNVACNGDTSGAIIVNATGGVSPYTYAIGTGTYGSNNSFSPLASGTYTIHIKDSNNCIKDTVIAITEPAKLEFDSLDITNPLCYNTATGSVEVNGTGGVTPYTYAQGTGGFGSSNTFGSLAQGSFVFRIKDSNNCEIDTLVTLVQPTPIIPTVSIKNATCNTIYDGEAIITAIGGTPNYKYGIATNTPTSSNVFSGLAAGSHVLRVVDTNGCTKDTSITINDSLDVIANITVNDVNCFDSADGSVVIAPAGGVNPYTYAINTGTFGTANTFSNLNIGSHSIHIKDDLGCKLDTNINITQPTRLNPVITSVNNISCNGYFDGLVTMSAFGGTNPYSYRIDTGSYSTISLFNNLYADTYTFYVKDDNGCIMDTSITLTEPAGMNMLLSLTDIACKGDSSGEVVVNASGGVSPYTYKADSNLYTSTPVLSGLNAGSHIIYIKDSNGCVKDSTISLSEPDSLLITNIDKVSATCWYLADGALTITGMGGVLPYQYALNSDPFVSNPNFRDIKAGMYTLMIKDANGCLNDTIVDLDGLPPIIIDSLIVEDISCFGFGDGSIKVYASGGVQPFSYKLGNGTPGNSNAFYTLNADNHAISVIDDAGCINDTGITIEEPQVIKITATATPNDCEGYDDGGRIELNVEGGTEPYQYEWQTEPKQYGATATGLTNGPFRAIVRDANDCIDTVDALVEYNNCCKLFIPDAFTPNGDGLNDDIRILLKGDFQLEVFSIFNRYGERVFTTNNMNEGWDGVWKGRPQDIGTFNYFVKGICGNNGDEEVMYKGTITLIR